MSTESKPVVQRVTVEGFQHVPGSPMIRVHGERFTEGRHLVIIEMIDSYGHNIAAVFDTAAVRRIAAGLIEKADDADMLTMAENDAARAAAK